MLCHGLKNKWVLAQKRLQQALCACPTLCPLFPRFTGVLFVMIQPPSALPPPATTQIIINTVPSAPAACGGAGCSSACCAPSGSPSAAPASLALSQPAADVFSPGTASASSASAVLGGGVASSPQASLQSSPQTPQQHLLAEYQALQQEATTLDAEQRKLAELQQQFELKNDRYQQLGKQLNTMAYNPNGISAPSPFSSPMANAGGNNLSASFPLADSPVASPPAGPSQLPPGASLGPADTTANPLGALGQGYGVPLTTTTTTTTANDPSVLAQNPYSQSRPSPAAPATSANPANTTGAPPASVPAITVMDVMVLKQVLASSGDPKMKAVASQAPPQELAKMLQQSPEVYQAVKSLEAEALQRAQGQAGPAANA